MNDIRLGRETEVYPSARICGNVCVGNRVIIDDFCFIYGNKEIQIGDFVHIATGASIVGNVCISDFVSVSGGVRIYGASENVNGEYLINPTIPACLRRVDRRPIFIGKHAFIGTNSVILPGVSIGVGAVVGALSLVKHDIPAWSIFAGGRIIKQRESEKILFHEKLLRSYAYDDNGEYQWSVSWLDKLKEYMAGTG